MLGVSITRSGSECESVILDSECIIRSYVAHDLNDRGMSFVLEVLKLSQLIIGEVPNQSSVGCFHPGDMETVRSSTVRCAVGIAYEEPWHDENGNQPRDVRREEGFSPPVSRLTIHECIVEGVQDETTGH